MRNNILNRPKQATAFAAACLSLTSKDNYFLNKSLRYVNIIQVIEKCFFVLNRARSIILS